MDSVKDAGARTVVVTGCSSGIGAAVVARLRDEGVRVIGLDIAPAESLRDVVWVDLSDPASIDAAVAALPDRIDALVNAAGVSSGIGDPLRVVAINILGLRRLTEAIVPRMPFGSYIANTASLAAERYLAHVPATLEFLRIADWTAALDWCAQHPEEVGAGYAFSKEAVVCYTAARAVELAGRGIRINATAPGVTETPILKDTIARLGSAYLDTIPKPLGRLATADEQARVLVFLAGEGASYLTGQTIWVDGGYTAGVATGEIEAFPERR